MLFTFRRKNVQNNSYPGKRFFINREEQSRRKMENGKCIRISKLHGSSDMHRYTISSRQNSGWNSFRKKKKKGRNKERKKGKN